MGKRDALEVFESHGLTATVEFEPDPQSPREWDSAAEILYMKTSRYILGDRGVDAEEMRETANDPNNIVLPVYAYIHGGATVSCGAFSCQWDSGQSGIIYMSKEKALAEFGRKGAKRLTKRIREAAEKCMRAEVETFANYLEGMVYTAILYDENGDVLDAIGDIHDTGKHEYATEEARGMLACELRKRRKLRQDKAERERFAVGAAD